MKYNGYHTRQFDVPVKRYCRMLDLNNDPELIAHYREMHSEGKHWPEIRDGIRQVGILEMEIYILDNHLFMIVETPQDFDWHTAMQKLGTLSRQQEWEDTMAVFQDCEAHATPADKWRMMERMFYLYN